MRKKKWTGTTNNIKLATLSLNFWLVCGLAHSPKDIPESIAQAAAGRAATILAKDYLEVGGVVSVIDGDKCVACLTCIRMCPYDVPVINEKGAVEIEAAKCQGSGLRDLRLRMSGKGNSTDAL